MTTIMAVLRIVSVFFSGIASGALWTIMMVALPIARRLPQTAGLRMRQNIDPLMDRFNPISVALSALAGVGILIVHHDLSHAAGVLTALGVLGMLGVVAISLGVIGRMSRTLKSWSADAVPPEYDSFADRWDSMHRLRTLLAIAAFACFAVAAVIR